MDAVRANQLRATIQTLTAEGLSPTAVARRLGCARGTVYNALARPGPDRRTRAAHPDALALDASVLGLLVADPERSTDDLHTILTHRAAAADVAPSRATVARAACRLRPAAAPRRDPYADLALPDYDVAVEADPAAAAPEIALLRALLRGAVKDLDQHGQTPRERLRYRAHAAAIADTIARTRAAPTRAAARSAEAERLAEAVEEVLR